MPGQIVLLIVTVLMFGADAVAAGAPCPVAVNLTVLKGSYMAGEPIEVRLTANNTGSEAASISAAYPAFGGGNDSELRFSVDGERPAVHRSQPPPGQYADANFRIPIVPLAPGETWSMSVFLQSFMPDLSPGDHTVTYSARLECAAKSDSETGPEGQGVFSVVVLKTGEHELATAIAELASRLDTTDQWARRSVEEGLLVTYSPLVIPLLRQILPGMKDAVVRALAKFPGNPDAKSIVLEVLRMARTIAQPYQCCRDGNI